MDMDNNATLTLFDLNRTEFQQQGTHLFVDANLVSPIRKYINLRSQFHSKIHFSCSLDSAKNKSPESY